MDTKRMVGIVLLLVGAVVLVVALAADAIGIGGHPGLGSTQIASSVGGAIVAVVGLVLTRRG